MNIQMVKSLFTLFSGVENTEEHLPLLMSVTDLIMKYVRSNADNEDIRLCFLAASVANLRYRYTSAKAIADMNMPNKYSATEQQIEFTKQLIGSYCDLCADLLIDTKDNTALNSVEV